ncbi:MAG TPA: porphobilinogen synthase, partial [Thermoanaerobaculia bacterium]|nr:porphobilinogen synthase [Thermoanaerobaculia bacterium]
MSFPETRLRRFRRTPHLRRLVRETRLSPDNLVLPLFVCPGEGIEKPVGSMPGVAQQSVDRLVETAREAFAEGVRSVLLFGIPEHKDASGSSAWSPDGIVQRALRALSKDVPGLIKIADVCFCEYTDHGH